MYNINYKTVAKDCKLDIICIFGGEKIDCYTNIALWRSL